jgi:hypothetical protein
MNAAFIPNKDGLQNTEACYFTISLAQFVANGNVVDIDVIPGAEVLRGHIVVETAFNTTGTDTLKIGDAVDDDRYLGATSIKAAARTAIVPTGYLIPGAGAKVRLTRTAADTAATVGSVRVFLEFAVLGKADTTQG